MLHQQLAASGIDDLAEVDAWQEVAHGIWKAELGDCGKITRYTDLAARPPQLQQINSLFERQAFPASFHERRIRFRVTEDHKTVVHIPLQPGEKIQHL